MQDNVENYIIASFPIYVGSSKLRNQILTIFKNCNIGDYIDIEKIDDFIPKEIEEVAEKMRKKFGEKKVSEMEQL